MKNKTKFDAGRFLIDHLNTIVFAVLILGLFGRVIVEMPYSVMQIPHNLINRVGAYVLIAIGAGTILMAGGADLSSGRIMGLCALISAALLQNANAMTKAFLDLKPMPVGTVLIIALILGAVISAINGLIVSGLNAPTFIVTLATQMTVYGAMLILIGLGTNASQSISNLSYEYHNFVIGNGIIPYYVIYAVAITLFLWIVYTFTPFGKMLRAVGADKAKAKASGINTMLITVLAFVIAGVLYGFNGFVEAARVGGPGASCGVNAEFDAITACLIGGMSVKGGVGGIGGVIIGVVLIQLLAICLQWLAISPNLIYIIKGSMLCLAVVIDMIRWKLVKVEK